MALVTSVQGTRDFTRGAISTLVAAQAAVDIWPDTGFDYIGIDSLISLWLSSTVDLATVSLTIQPPGGGPLTIINPGYPVNVENYEIDDEWDIIFRDLPIQADSQMHLYVSSTNAGQLWWKAMRRPAPAAVGGPPNVMIDGAITSIPANASVDILLNSITRRRPMSSLFTLFGSAAATGLTAVVSVQEERLNQLISGPGPGNIGGYPVNVRTQAIAAVKDRMVYAEPVAGQAILSGPITNTTGAAIPFRWHAASVA